MIRKPNLLQKFIHRFFMLRPVTAFFASRVQRIDMAILKLTRGRFAGSELLGWNIIQLTTKGAKTGQRRTTPLVALFDGERIALIATNLGREAYPGWYYNLKAHPGCQVQWKGQIEAFLAREVAGAEYEKYWQLGLSYYAGFEKYRARAGRHIPVMLLDPEK